MQMAAAPQYLSGHVALFLETRGSVCYTLEKLIPDGHAIFMINLGPPQMVVEGGENGVSSNHVRAWLSGIHDRPLYTAPVAGNGAFHTHFIAASLTFSGVYSLFGIAASEVANRVIDAELLFGEKIRHLHDQMGELDTTPQRFALLAGFLQKISEKRSRPVHPGVLEAIEKTLHNPYDLRVSGLCQQLDISRKHLNTVYRQNVGVSPKTFARLVRFHAIVDRLSRPHFGDWAGRAIDAGYFDQAHMHRDFAQFAAEPPGAFMQQISDDGMSIVYDAEHNVLR